MSKPWLLALWYWRASFFSPILAQKDWADWYAAAWRGENLAAPRLTDGLRGVTRVDACRGPFRWFPDRAGPRKRSTTLDGWYPFLVAVIRTTFEPGRALNRYTQWSSVDRSGDHEVLLSATFTSAFAVALPVIKTTRSFTSAPDLGVVTSSTTRLSPLAPHAPIASVATTAPAARNGLTQRA
jgi:hypothetical protein